MNNEFQWRNEMRKLGGPVDPVRDLWPSIAARIAAAPGAASAATRRRHVRWMALAAAIIVAVGSAITAYRWQNTDTRSSAATSPSAAKAMDGREKPQAVTAHESTPQSAPVAATELQQTALDWAVPADPQLAAAAQNLDTASAQLQDALEQHPDAVFLVGLLNRTNAQRLRLMRKSPYAG